MINFGPIEIPPAPRPEPPKLSRNQRAIYNRTMRELKRGGRRRSSSGGPAYPFSKGYVARQKAMVTIHY